MRCPKCPVHFADLSALSPSKLHHIHGRPLHTQGVPGVQHQRQLRHAVHAHTGIEHRGVLQRLEAARHPLQGEAQRLRLGKRPAGCLSEADDPLAPRRGHRICAQRAPNCVRRPRIQPDLGGITRIPADALSTPGLLPPGQAAARTP